MPRPPAALPPSEMFLDRRRRAHGFHQAPAGLPIRRCQVAQVERLTRHSPPPPVAPPTAPPAPSELPPLQQLPLILTEPATSATGPIRRTSARCSPRAGRTTWTQLVGVLPRCRCAPCQLSLAVWQDIGGDAGSGPGAYLSSARMVSQPGDGSCLFHSLVRAHQPLPVLMRVWCRLMEWEEAMQGGTSAGASGLRTGLQGTTS